MVSCLRHYDESVVSIATSFSAVQVLILTPGFSNNDGSGISSVTKDESVLLLVHSHEGASTQLAVELVLFLKLCLDVKESRDSGLADVLIQALCCLWLTMRVHDSSNGLDCEVVVLPVPHPFRHVDPEVYLVVGDVGHGEWSVCVYL